MTHVQRFLRELHKYLEIIGAKPVGNLGYRWRVDTIAGKLNIIVYHKPDHKRVKVYSIYTKFDEPARAVPIFGNCLHEGRVNPYSGKWNHSYRTWDVCLDLFKQDVTSILKNSD